MPESTAESTLKALDRAIAGLCPCGAQPPPGETYCGDDCRPAPGAGLPMPRHGWPARVRRPAPRRRSTPERATQELTPEQQAERDQQIRQALAGLGRAAEEWARQVAAAVEAFARALAPAVEHIGHVHVQLQQAGAIEQEPPTDPRERALWLRRNRNTGPRQERKWSPRAQARESRRSR